MLPIVMTAINIIAGAIYTKGFPFKEKAQIYGMALLFLVLLYNSPAGLVLYWTMNNVFSLVKNIFYKLKHPVWVLYILMCAGIVFVDIYILFLYGGSASLGKRLMVVIPFTCLVFVPYLVKGVNYVLDKKISNLTYSSTSVKLRILVPVVLAWTLLSGLVLPSSLISSSVSEFSDIGEYGNPTIFVWFSFFQSLGVFVFWPTCIFFLFKEKVQTLLTIIFSVGFVCSVVNAFFFVVNYGSMGITLTFDSDLKTPSVVYSAINLCVMLVLCLLVVFLLIKHGKKIFFSITVIAILSFSVFGVVNINSINEEYIKYQDLKKRNENTVDYLKPVFNFSKTGQNVVIIMLDRASSAYLEHIFNDQPDLYDMFDGFTYYKNMISFAPKTLTSSPSLYGGYEYSPIEINNRAKLPLKEKHNESLLLIPRIFTENADYNATLYDSSWGNYSHFSDMSFTDSYEKIQGLSLQHRYEEIAKKELGFSFFTESLEKGLKRNLLWFSLFRQAPIIARSIIYYHGTYFNPEDILYSGYFWGWFSTLCTLPYITSFDVPQNSLMIMTNETTHELFDNDTVQLMEYNPLSYPDYPHYKENTLALKSLGNWFNTLKENGVYDNTRIIIVSDHGIGTVVSDKVLTHDDFDKDEINGFPKDYLHALLLYKDFGTEGKLLVDNTFMTTADVPTLALNGIVENPVNPFTGNPVNSDAKKDGVYVTSDVDMWMPEHSKSEYIFTVSEDSWYHVKDNIFVDSNWTQEVPK